MGRSLIDLLRMGRPHFLLGGLLQFALGAAIARWLGYPIDAKTYWLGQLAVTGVQWMTHYLNEYWDADADRLNASRTLFSGGSGVPHDGRLPRATALAAGLACMALGLGAFTALAIEGRVSGLATLLFALSLVGAFFYSTPPLALAGSGYGELTASLIVGGLLPMFSYTLQTDRLGSEVALASLPLVLLHLAMLLAFELPDEEADRLGGKRTLLVRVGRLRALQLHNAMIGLAYLALIFAGWRGLPWPIIAGTFIAAPMAILQVWLTRRLRQRRIVLWSWLTSSAVILFALTSYLEALGFWRLG